MLEKLTCKLCNILLSNENYEMTILPPSFPRKADRNIATMKLWLQQKLTQHSKRINGLVRLENFASEWFSLAYYLVLTYQSKNLCQ